jgi:hypothetical protein
MHGACVCMQRETLQHLLKLLAIELCVPSLDASQSHGAEEEAAAAAAVVMEEEESSL